MGSDLSRDDILAVPCPDCGATAEAVCVYVPLRIDPTFLHLAAPSVQSRYLLNGTPTKVPHVGRRMRARPRLADQARAAYRRALRRTAVPAGARRRYIARLETEFDRREYERLRLWLARFADVLTVVRETERVTPGPTGE